jgi:hypothetical protein
MSSSENPSDPIVISRSTADCTSPACPSGTFRWEPTAAGQKILADMPEEDREKAVAWLTAHAHVACQQLGLLLGLLGPAADVEIMVFNLDDLDLDDLGDNEGER